MVSQKTSFGFREVNISEKQGLVREVFDVVSPNYDIMNDAMSFGLHRIWKDRLIANIRPAKNIKLIDVAGGTGDIAFRFLKAGGGFVSVCDINASMLNEGRKRSIDDVKIVESHINKQIEWVCGNAENLPFKPQEYDVYTIAFGIRNVTNISLALEQAYKILKSGGHFLCLEFAIPPNIFMQKIYDAYSFNIIPKMGKLLAGDSKSYQYLVESIRKFPLPNDFENMIKDAGFIRTKYTPLNGGIVNIHQGWKI